MNEATRGIKRWREKSIHPKFIEISQVWPTADASFCRHMSLTFYQSMFAKLPLDFVAMERKVRRHLLVC
jgi:hypothetical protein